jgi:hypothetical protein
VQKLIFILLLLLTAVTCLGQYTTPPHPRLVSVLPDAPCNAADFVQLSAAPFTPYLCGNNAWAALASGVSSDGTTVSATQPLVVSVTGDAHLEAGLGVGTGNFFGSWTNADHTAQYFGSGGSASFANTTGTANDAEVYGGQFTARVLGTNTGGLNNDTSGIAGLQSSWKTLTGATGTLTRMVGINTLMIPSAVGATVTNAIGFQMQGLTGSGPVTNAAGFATTLLSTATNNTHLLLGSTTPAAGNFGIYDVTGYKNQFSGPTTITPLAALPGDGTQSVLKLSTTFPSVLTSSIFGMDVAITGAGSSAFAPAAQRIQLLAGYTGPATTSGTSVTNFTVGTGADFIAGSYNAGTISSDRGTTVGDNVGIAGIARDGGFSVGTVGKAIVSKSSSTNVGAIGLAQNTGGSSQVQVGGYFSLLAVKPTLVSAGLLASNGSTTDPIFIALDNTSPVFTIADGGNVTVTNKVTVPELASVTKVTNVAAAINIGDTAVAGHQTLLTVDDPNKIISLQVPDDGRLVISSLGGDTAINFNATDRTIQLVADNGIISEDALTVGDLHAGSIFGTAFADNAAAGGIGEFVQALLASGSATSLTTATAKNITSISLTAGDWDVSGNINFSAGTATVTGTAGGISTMSATLPTDGSEVYSGVQVTLLSETDSVTLPRKRISIATTTTVYLVGRSTFSAGSVSGFGQINARRVR